MRKNYHKRLPDHMFPAFDKEIGQWGIYNSRLRQWMGKDEDFGHTVYASKEEALEKFLETF